MSIWTTHCNEQSTAYLKSKRWKCKKSPTGAHVWVVTTKTEHGLTISEHVCKCCKERKLILRQAL